MGTKVKGIYKGFKYISQIFVVKDREMEIGFPTDVKHVAHIGWDGSGSAPSWMEGFKTGPEFASTSIGHSGSALSPWSSRDFAESLGQNPSSGRFSDIPPQTDMPNIPKKPRRKKQRSTSSPKSSSPTTRSSRATKSKAKFIEGDIKPSNIEVV